MTFGRSSSQRTTLEASRSSPPPSVTAPHLPNRKRHATALRQATTHRLTRPSLPHKQIHRNAMIPLHTLSRCLSAATSLVRSFPDLETVDLDVGLLRDLLRDEELSNLHALVALDLDDLAELLVLGDVARAGELLSEVLDQLLAVDLRV